MHFYSRTVISSSFEHVQISQIEDGKTQISLKLVQKNFSRKIALIHQFLAPRMEFWVWSIVFMGETPDPGGPHFRKIWDFWDMKLKIFGAEGAKIFEKCRALRKN